MERRYPSYIQPKVLIGRANRGTEVEDYKKALEALTRLVEIHQVQIVKLRDEMRELKKEG